MILLKWWDGLGNVMNDIVHHFEKGYVHVHRAYTDFHSNEAMEPAHVLTGMKA